MKNTLIWPDWRMDSCVILLWELYSNIGQSANGPLVYCTVLYCTVRYRVLWYSTVLYPGPGYSTVPVPGRRYCTVPGIYQKITVMLYR